MNRNWKLVLLLAFSLFAVGYSLLGSGEPLTLEDKTIFLNIRLPKLILSFSVGAILSLSGLIYQYLLKNPLSEPYLLGISGSGALGAVLAILFLSNFPFAREIFSLLGAMGGLGLILFFGRKDRYESDRLILFGVMVGTFCSSLLTFLMTFETQNLEDIIFWLMGGIPILSSGVLIWFFALSLGLLLFILVFHRKVDLLALDDRVAQSLGISPQWKLLFLVVASLPVAVTVSVCGMIGFVGLLVPHLCRLIFLAETRFISVPVWLVGGVFLVFCEGLSRGLTYPIQIPVGALSALLGAPLLIYFLIRKGRGDF